MIFIRRNLTSRQEAGTLSLNRAKCKHMQARGLSTEELQVTRNQFVKNETNQYI